MTPQKVIQVYIDQTECEDYEDVSTEYYECYSHEGSDKPYRDYDGDGVSAVDGDCDDEDPTVGSDENDDGIQDCGDQDGDGYTQLSGDCDDTRGDIHPRALEYCDGLDDDCDGAVDEGSDGDGDGVTVCATPVDCDDEDPDRYPGADDVCDGIDNDCHGLVDNRSDDDGDGYSTHDGCAADGDCDDSDAQIHPGVDQVCDGQDQDCDGAIDEDFDPDGDGYTTCFGPIDCDTADPSVNPGAAEVCDDGIDQDCDGVSGVATDADGDGYATCSIDGSPLDCNDADSAVWPGALEQCDGVDNDCDGTVDDGISSDTGELEPNDSAAAPQELGTINGTVSDLYASISTESDEDWYRFYSSDDLVDGGSAGWNIEVWLDALPSGADYDLYVYKEAPSATAPLATSATAGASDEHVLVTGSSSSSDSGYYLVQIVRKSGTYGCPAYHLRITAT